MCRTSYTSSQCDIITKPRTPTRRAISTSIHPFQKTLYQNDICKKKRGLCGKLSHA